MPQMQQEKCSDSKPASIQQILNQNKHTLDSKEIKQLFSTPHLSELNLTELKNHPYMRTNDMFIIFVQELDKWNRKVRNRQVQPFYQAQLKRNMFLLSSLKTISQRKTFQIQRYLQQLTVWYNKNSYNVPQPSVLMKPYNPNEEWEIRKTFKSNEPSEIGNYRRRYLCIPDQRLGFQVDRLLKTQSGRKNQNCFLQLGPINKNRSKSNPKNKTMEEYINDDKKYMQPYSEIGENKQTRLLKLSNKQTRKKRQTQQIDEIQKVWKMSHGRFGQKTCQKFLSEQFDKSKQFSSISSKNKLRKVITAALNSRKPQQIALIDNIKKTRIKTSLGIRKNFMHQQNGINKGVKTVNLRIKSNQETKEEMTLENWIDRFVVDEEKIDFTKAFNNYGPNMLLISNPFDAVKNKIRNKKR